MPWLLTYADMVTLLFTFFVLLFSFSQVDNAKWQQTVSSLSGGTGVLEQPMPIDPLESVIPPIINLPSATAAALTNEAREPTEQEAKEQSEIDDGFDELYAGVEAYMQANELSELMQIQREEGKVVLSFKDKMLFDSGSTELNEDSEAFLTEIFMMLESNQDSFSMLRVEGHTDNMPIKSTRYQDNWELSSARAATVLRFIQSGTTIDPGKLSMVAYGEMQPVADNSTEEGKAKNRRVDLICERRDVLNGS